MPVLHFTDLSIRSLKEGSFYDDKMRGFGIRVGKHRKVWHVVKDPRRTKVTIGYWPDLSLAEARRKAAILLNTPHIQSTAPTFLEARTLYLEQGKWRPKTRYETTRTLTRHFHWTKPIDKITYHDVLEIIEAIKAPAEARAAQRDLSVFFNWCVPRYLKSSPCAGLKPPSRYIPRERVLSDDELSRIWIASEQLGDFGVIIKLCILTGQRRGELSHIRSEWIANNTISIPATSTKTKRKHSIPCGPISTGLLKALPFSLNNWGRNKKRLDNLSGVMNWTIHDLRRTYATIMQRIGIRLEVTENLLGHSESRAGVIGIYQRHDFWPEMQEAVAKYEHIHPCPITGGLRRRDASF